MNAPRVIVIDEVERMADDERTRLLESIRGRWFMAVTRDLSAYVKIEHLDDEAWKEQLRKLREGLILSARGYGKSRLNAAVIALMEQQTQLSTNTDAEEETPLARQQEALRQAKRRALGPKRARWA